MPRRSTGRPSGASGSRRFPREGRGYALDLHRQFEQAHSERSQALAEREKELDGMAAVDAALAPWRETLAARGLTDADAVTRLMEAQAALEKDPGAALAALAEGRTTTSSPPWSSTTSSRRRPSLALRYAASRLLRVRVSSLSPHPE